MLYVKIHPLLAPASIDAERTHCVRDHWSSDVMVSVDRRGLACEAACMYHARKSVTRQLRAFCASSKGTKHCFTEFTAQASRDQQRTWASPFFFSADL